MCKHIAAVLYGVGARLDHQPELLFLLRNVDHEELITADLDIQAATTGKGKRRRLAGADLADVFGVDMDQPVTPAGKKNDVDNTAQGKKTQGKKKKGFTPTSTAVTKLRKRFNMNTSQFAKLVGVSPPTVSNWENGSGKLTLRQRTLEALTRVAELAPEQAERELKRRAS
jgi:DNA-binding transcriptional regulator YiaG